MSGIPLKGPVRHDDLEIIKNGGVVVEDGLLLEIGLFEELHKTYNEISEVSGSRVAMPGLIDCHTHLIWGGSRELDFERRNSGMTYQEILTRGGGIFDTVSKTRNASSDQLEKDLIERSMRHIKSGVTTIEVKTGYGLTGESEIRLLRSINKVSKAAEADLIPTFLGAHVCPEEYRKSDYLDYLVKEVFPVINTESLASRVDIFIEEEAFPAGIASKYLGEARENGFDLTCHAGQFSAEGVGVAVQNGTRSADHLESIGENDILMLAKSETAAVALPGASLGLGMAFTPARKLLDAGCSLAIATDWNPGSAPMGDLITGASILATYEKLTSAEVLSALTFRAANALGLHDRGKLEAGMKADFISFPSPDYLEILYAQGKLMPSEIWKNGKLM